MRKPCQYLEDSGDEAVVSRLKRKSHTSTAVIGALRSRETAFRPTVRLAINVKEGILLFKTEPREGVLGLVHNFLRVVTEISAVGGAIVVVGLCKNENVVTTAERILEDGSGAEIDVRVISRSLIGGRAIKVPNAKGADVSDLFAHGLP